MLDWTAPFQAYEAACPFAVWLNSVGLVSDDIMAELVGLMFYLMRQNEVIAERQVYWIELVYILKTAAQSLFGIGS